MSSAVEEDGQEPSGAIIRERRGFFCGICTVFSCETQTVGWYNYVAYFHHMPILQVPLVILRAIHLLCSHFLTMMPTNSLKLFRYLLVELCYRGNEEHICM